MGGLAIRTNDFQLAYRLIKKLRELDIQHIQLEHEGNIPSDVSFWFASTKEVNESSDSRGIACDIYSLDSIVSKTLNRLLSGPNVNILSFGIDTGPRPGIAWFADERSIGCMQLESVDGVVDQINQIIYDISPRYPSSSIVRIGNGPRTLSNRIVNLCLAEGLYVELVDENNTSRGSRHDHVSAAKNIGKKSGIPIFSRLKVIPTKGEVREIQRTSRCISEGRTTIPSNLARSVAVGKLSLIEAVNLHSQ
jgi:hypothetical protein|tara:strand:- start:436 stop:1185 length:750 start_codon:yes stop_codon:yes gene_type:complete